MPDCDENMFLRFVMPKKFKAPAQLVTSSARFISIMNINGLASDVIRLG